MSPATTYRATTLHRLRAGSHGGGDLRGLDFLVVFLEACVGADEGEVGRTIARVVTHESAGSSQFHVSGPGSTIHENRAHRCAVGAAHGKPHEAVVADQFGAGIPGIGGLRVAAHAA